MINFTSLCLYIGYSVCLKFPSPVYSVFYLRTTIPSLGEGNGTPLQCSCPENPRDGGAWWAAVYGSHRVGHYWSDLAAAAAFLL